ncbi:MAG: hypothetical protein ACPIOQ_70805, partial [Promethearchaeia archaeon]
ASESSGLHGEYDPDGQRAGPRGHLNDDDLDDQKAAAAMQRGCWCWVARRISVKFTLAMDGHVWVCVGVTVAKCLQAQRDISLAFCSSVEL